LSGTALAFTKSVGGLRGSVGKSRTSERWMLAIRRSGSATPVARRVAGLLHVGVAGSLPPADPAREQSAHHRRSQHTGEQSMSPSGSLRSNSSCAMSHSLA
jgi:hypothetical protein